MVEEYDTAQAMKVNTYVLNDSRDSDPIIIQHNDTDPGSPPTNDSGHQGDSLTMTRRSKRMKDLINHSNEDPSSHTEEEGEGDSEEEVMPPANTNRFVTSKLCLSGISERSEEES